MPSRVYWYLPKRIIINQHIGRVNIETLINAVETTLDLASEVDRAFHLLIDARQLEHTPNNIGELSKIARGLLANQHLERIFVTTANPLHKFIGNLVIQLLKKPAQIVTTIDEALVSLQRLDTSLPPLAEIKPDMSQVIEID